MSRLDAIERGAREAHPDFPPGTARDLLALLAVARAAQRLDVHDLGEHGIAVVGLDEVRAALTDLEAGGRS